MDKHSKCKENEQQYYIAVYLLELQLSLYPFQDPVLPLEPFCIHQLPLDSIFLAAKI